ncbi:unnamed protein product [Meganyctiphanes norvegica]|uniref:C-type lectin domain-containing protein n=1 Tax=Meganyctiphanes norvegica TaxID=48144 RepID=A0AAV2R7V0_MEGNR
MFLSLALLFLLSWKNVSLMIISNLKYENLNQKTNISKIDSSFEKYSYSDINITLITSNAACSPYRISIQGKCYFVDNEPYPIDKSIAKNSCKRNHLGDIAGKPPGNWGNWTKSLQLRNGTYYWVNLTKSNAGWFWPNGDAVVEWDNGQPSGAGGSSACATVSGGSDKLAEVPCSGKYAGTICDTPASGICYGNVCECFEGYFGKSCQYDCKYDCLWPKVCSIVGSTSVCRCHDGSIEDSNRCIPLVICPANYTEICGYCYKVIEYDLKSWVDAHASCKTIPEGALAEPPLLNWNICLKGLQISMITMYYWINLQKTQNGWNWLSGKKVEHWQHGQPDGSASDDACASLNKRDTLLMEQSCSSKFPFICEAPKSGCVPGYFGKICMHGFPPYVWLSGAAMTIILLFIASAIYFTRQHIKYKDEIEYKMCNKPRGHCIIMYTREENIYISQVNFAPKDPQNLPLHEGQVIEMISPTTHKDILYVRPYGIENAKEGYFTKKHVQQSKYGLADADLCADLWTDLDFTVHKMEVNTVEDFKMKLINCRKVISTDTRPQDCFSFTFIGHGYTEEQTEFIELKGFSDEYDDDYSNDMYCTRENTLAENRFEENGYFVDDESNEVENHIKKNEQKCIVSLNNSNNTENSEISMNLEGGDNDIQSNGTENSVVLPNLEGGDNDKKSNDTENRELLTNLEGGDNDIQSNATENSELLTNLEGGDNDIQSNATENSELLTNLEGEDNDIQSNDTENSELLINLEGGNNDIQSNVETDSVGSMPGDYIKIGFPVRLIYELFTSQQCPRLGEVPKLFYIQACRGEKIDNPLLIVDENYLIHSNETAARAFITIPRIGNKINLTSETVASCSDLYVFCSSFAGYFSYFSRKKGNSFFIEEICKIYKKDYKKHTLSEMNTKVKDKVSKMNISIGVTDEKQIPTVSVDTLRKILRFK